MTRIPTALLVVSLAATGHLAAQGPSPGGIALARELAEIINRGDSASAALFLESRLSPAALQPSAVSRYAALLMGVYRQGRGVSLRTVEALGGGVAMTLWARNADRGMILYVATDPADTTRLARLSALRFVHPGAAVRSLPRLHLSADAFTTALKAELDRLTAADEFAGTVVIARGATVLFEESFGKSVRPAGEPNTAATRYHLASVGKMFTATAIGQLVEAGKLSFDDSVGRLLPGLPWAQASRAITVRQLLSHTSGLGQSERAGDAIDSAFAATPGAFPPGARFAYSNDGYEILGLIIERVSGQRYHDYVRDHVYRPAGMEDTDAYPAEEPLAHRATGYGHRDGDYFGAEPPVPNTNKVKGRGTAAGGSYGTARDLSRFGAALLEGTLLRSSMLDSLTRPRWRLPGPFADARYGYGFESYKSNGRRVIGHGGGGAGWGICARLAIIPELKYTVAVLTNVDPPLCEEVSRAIVAALGPAPS